MTVSLGDLLLRKAVYYPYPGQERGIIIESERNAFYSPGHAPNTQCKGGENNEYRIYGDGSDCEGSVLGEA